MGRMLLGTAVLAACMALPCGIACADTVVYHDRSARTQVRGISTAIRQPQQTAPEAHRMPVPMNFDKALAYQAKHVEDIRFNLPIRKDKFGNRSKLRFFDM